MKKCFNYLIFLLIITFLFNISVNALSCDEENIARLRVLANNIKASYENISNLESLDIKYLVSFSNVSEELVIVDEGYNEWHGKDAKDGVISFEKIPEYKEFKYRVYGESCSSKSVKTITIKLPMYNAYYKSDECKKLSKYNLDVCQQWVNSYISDDTFLEVVNKYNIREENSKFNIVKYLLNHIYIVIIVGLIIISGIVLLIVRARKRSVLE